MLRIGLIGAGGIVQKTHAIGYRALGADYQVTALADPSEFNQSLAGEQFGVQKEHRYADYRNMLSSIDLDVVVIATPHHLHAGQTIDAAEAGVSVICEKPMAVSIEDGQRIADAVTRHRVHYTVVHNLLWSDAVRSARDIVMSGQIGRPILGRGEMLASKPVSTTQTHLDWRASRAHGGGALIDSSYHEIYTVEALMGSPITSVDAHLRTLKFSIDVDDTAMMLFDHEDGGASQVTASWCARAPGHPGRWVSVSGTDGAVRIVYGDPQPLSVFRDVAPRWETSDHAGRSGSGLIAEPDQTGHGAFLVTAFRAVAQGDPMPVPVERAFHNLAVIDAARRANETRRSAEVKKLGVS